MTFSSISLLSEQTYSSLQKERYSLANLYKQKGLQVLLREIDKRSRHPGAFLYVLLDPLGRIVQANAEQVETDNLRGPTHSYSYLHYGQEAEHYAHKAMAVSLTLQNGFRLLIGRDLNDLDKYIKITSHALFAALILMFIGAFLIWFFVSRRVLKTIDNITKASGRIMAGDLTERLPVSCSNDELARLVVNLNVMLEKIEKLNSGIKEISDNVAHDLKTPLTRLKNIAQASLIHAQSPDFSAAMYQNSLSAIIGQVDQIITTFNAILLVSRLETSNSTEILSYLNVKDLLLDVIEFCAPVAQNAGIELSVGQTFDYSMFLNRELVAQALFNIFDNAIKYGTSNAEPSRVTIDMQLEVMANSIENLLIIVQDNGEGVNEQELEKLSERFYRAEKSRTQPGIGIGLNLVKAVMHFHNGAMALSNTGNGFKVVLSFPNNKGEPYAGR